MSLLYNTGGAIGSIDVLVNSVDYYGRAVGNLSTQYQFKSECNKNYLKIQKKNRSSSQYYTVFVFTVGHEFEVEAIVSNNTSFFIVIKVIKVINA